MKEKLTYRFTKSKDERESYYQLREQTYKKEYGIVRSEERIDADSEILVIMRGKQCLGGARLTMRVAGEATLLPMENQTFKLNECLPKLQLGKVSYAEMSDVIIKPGYRGNRVMEQLYRRVNLKARQLNIRYIFIVTSALAARRHVKSYQGLGFQARLLPKIEMPAWVREKYGSMAEHLVIFDLEPQNISPIIERYFDSLDARFLTEHDIHEVIYYFSYIKSKRIRKEILDLLKILSSS